MKFQEVLTSGLPALSLMLVDAVAVYLVFGARAVLGFRVDTRVVVL